MGFGVFIHRSDSIYDDSPSERYQFPQQYLSRVEACIGNWIVYYEPKKVTGTRGYFAAAKVERVIADPKTPSMFLALIEPGSYLDFANPVPFRSDNGLVERGLLNAEGRLSGRAQAAVRPLSVSDFNRILSIGLAEEDAVLPRVGEAVPPSGLEEEPVPFEQEDIAVRERSLYSRAFRDRVFRRNVLQVYEERCAISGLKLINGAGRAEAVAAHIQPVHANGPDSVNNGIALSGTVHWLFDRGLIGLADDLEILISRQVNDQDGVRTFINKSGRALSPQSPSARPHPRFLQWHREHCFKQ